jgi:hypothetical protein
VSSTEPQRSRRVHRAVKAVDLRSWRNEETAKGWEGEPRIARQDYEETTSSAGVLSANVAAKRKTPGSGYPLGSRSSPLIGRNTVPG